MKNAESEWGANKNLMVYRYFLFSAEKLLRNEIDEKLRQEEEEKQKEGLDIGEAKNLFKSVLGRKPTNSSRVEKGKKKRTECGCLPSCTSLNYNIETSQSDWEWVKRFEGLKRNYSDFEGKKMSVAYRSRNHGLSTQFFTGTYQNWWCFSRKPNLSRPNETNCMVI